VFCQKCGTEVARGSNYCLKCGTALFQPPWAVDETARHEILASRLQDARWLLVLSFLAVFLIIVIGLAVVALPQEASTPMTPGRPRAETPTISEGLTAPQVSEPFSPFLSREDRNRLVQIAQDYSDPRQRDTVPDTMAPGEILRRGADFEGKTVTVEAEVSKKTLLYSIAGD